MKTVNIENIETRIENVTSVLKNFSLTKYMLPIQLKQLRFERDCLRKLMELMENKPVPVNPVELPGLKVCSSDYAGSQLWIESQVWNKAIDSCAEALRQQGYEVKS